MKLNGTKVAHGVGAERAFRVVSPLVRAQQLIQPSAVLERR